MVCDRCKMMVDSELKKLGLTPVDVQLGEVEIREYHIDDTVQALEKRLEELGFALISDAKSKTVEQIKNLIIELIHKGNDSLQINLSDHLSQTLQKDYHSLSSLFSEREGSTIEKFFIRQKIERVKELLTYGELNLNEIAYQLNYSSVAHLSTQFKKTLGISPSAYKKLSTGERIALDKV